MIGKKALRQLKASNAGARAINVLRIASAVSDAETVVIGADTFELDTALTSTITAGRIRVDLSAAGTKAFSTLTSDATNVADAETCTLDATVYRFKNTLAAAYDVKIGADAATTLANLKAAINATGTAGTEYFAGTLIHPSCNASTITATTLLVTANVTGTAGNSIATTETSAHLSWTSTVLASGAQPTATQAATALETAINASSTLHISATKISANELLIFGQAAGALGTACTETLAGSNNVWMSATMVGGAANSIPKNWIQSRAAVAQEVTLGNMHFGFPFIPVFAIVQVTSSSGAKKAWDGAYVINATTGNIVIDNSGSTDWAATDIVTVFASE